MIIACPQCDKEHDKPAGEVNRTRKRGGKIYCGRVCAGLARRIEKPPVVREPVVLSTLQFQLCKAWTVDQRFDHMSIRVRRETVSRFYAMAEKVAA